MKNAFAIHPIDESPQETAADAATRLRDVLDRQDELEMSSVSIRMIKQVKDILEGAAL